MKRLIIILDDLRRDVAREYLHPIIGGSFYPCESLDYWTFPVFGQISVLLDDVTCKKCIITGGGWIERIRFKNTSVRVFSLSPIMDNFGDIISYAKKGKSLVIVHDFYVHQYFEDIDRPIRDWDVRMRDKLWKLYCDRTKQVAEKVKDLISNFENWQIYITTDHGEAFWDDGVNYHHPPEFEACGIIREIFVIAYNSPKLDYKQLFQKKI